MSFRLLKNFLIVKRYWHLDLIPNFIYDSSLIIAFFTVDHHAVEIRVSDMFARANALDLITYVYARSISVAEQHAAVLQRQKRLVLFVSDFYYNVLSSFYINVHPMKSNSKYSLF